MKRNRNGISLFLKRKIVFFETENHWPYICYNIACDVFLIMEFIV